jgi:methylmalonyl-CoA mutase C-terminal domain/subunit
MSLRVVLAKPGLDGHESGILLVARALRDAGMDVIYLGCRQSAEGIAEAAMQEGADVVGISILTGGHLAHVRALQAAFAERGVGGEVHIVVGGIIPENDVTALIAMGVGGVFTVGSSMRDIVSGIRSLGEDQAVERADADRLVHQTNHSKSQGLRDPGDERHDG